MFYEKKRQKILNILKRNIKNNIKFFNNFINRKYLTRTVDMTIISPRFTLNNY